jgi:hypothetical protein
MNEVDFCSRCGASREELVNYGNFSCRPTPEGQRFAAEKQAAMNALADEVLAMMGLIE